MIIAAIDKAGDGSTVTDVKKLFGSMTEISPEELRHAAIFACARQIKDGATAERLKLWRKFFLTATVRFEAGRWQGKSKQFCIVVLAGTSEPRPDVELFMISDMSYMVLTSVCIDANMQ